MHRGIDNNGVFRVIVGGKFKAIIDRIRQVKIAIQYYRDNKIQYAKAINECDITIANLKQELAALKRQLIVK